MDDTQSITSEMSIYRRKEETSNLIHDPRDIVRSHEKSLTLILLQDILQIKGNYFPVLSEANYSKDKIVSIVSLAPEEQRSSISNDFPPFDLDEDQHGCDLLFYLYYPFRYNLVIGKQSVELNDRVTVSLEMNNRSDEFVLRLSFPPKDDNEHPYLLLKFTRRSSVRKWQKKLIDILLDLVCMKSLKDIYSILCYDEDEGKPKSPQKETAMHRSAEKKSRSRFQYDLFYTILSEFNRKLLQIQELFQLNYSSNGQPATPVSTASMHSHFSFSTQSISNNADQLSYYLQKFLSSHYFLSTYFKVSQITFEFISFLKTLARPSGLLSRAYGFAEDSNELKEMEKIVSLVIHENLQTFFMKNDYYIAFNEQIQRITNENTIVKTLDNEQTTIAELNEEETLRKLSNSQKFQETEEQFVRSAKFFASIPSNNNVAQSQRMSRSLSDLSISSAIPEGGPSYLPPRVGGVTGAGAGGSGRYLDLTANHLSLMNKMHLQPGSLQPSNNASNNLLSSRNSDLGSIQSDLPSIISQGGGRQNAIATSATNSNMRRVGSGTNLKRIIKFNGIELTNPNQLNNSNNNNSSSNKEDLPIPGQTMQHDGRNANHSNKDTTSPLVNHVQKSPVQKNTKNDEDEASDFTFMTEKENKNSQSLFDPIHTSGIKKEKEHIQRILSEMIFPLPGEEEREPVQVTPALQEKTNQTEEIPLGYDEFPDEFILPQTLSPLLSKPSAVAKEKVENENRKTLQEPNRTPVKDERNEQRTLSSSISRSADSNKGALPASTTSPKPPSVAASPSHHHRKRSNSKSQSTHSALPKRRSSSGGDHEEIFSVLDLPGDKSSPMPSSEKHKKKTHKERTTEIHSDGEVDQGYSPEIHQGDNDKSPKVFDIFKIVLCFFIVGLLWYNMTHPELFLKNNKMKRPSMKINNSKNKKMPAPQQQQNPGKNSPSTVQQQQLKRQQQLKQFFQQQPTNLEGNNYIWKDNPKPVVVAVDNPQQTMEEPEVVPPAAQIQQSTTAPKFIMLEELQQENDLDEQIAQKLKKLQQLEEMNQRIKEIESFSDPLDVIDPVAESDHDQEEEEVVLQLEMEEDEVGEGVMEEEIETLPVSTNNGNDEIIIEPPSREQQFPSDQPEKFSQNDQMNMNNMNKYAGSTSLQVRPKAFSNFFQNIFFSLKMKMKSFFGRFAKRSI
jgi:hypothetical protein